MGKRVPQSTQVPTSRVSLLPRPRVTVGWRKTVVIPVLILALGARTPVALADLIRIVAGG